MNYISLNAKYYKTSDYAHIYDHDMRHSNVTYKLENTQYKNFEFEFAKFEDLHTTKAQIMQRKGTNLRSNENSVVEFVCALSLEQTKKVLSQKDGYEKLNSALKSTMQKISEKYGFTSLFYAFHGDEGYKKNDKNVHNFHAHLTFYNYDFKKEKSVLKGIKKDEWGKMQDLAAKCFQDTGLDFIRGEKKETKEKDHLERKLFIGAKKEAIKDVNTYLEKSINNIFENSTEKGIFSNKINETLLKQNIKKEVFKALKFDIMPLKDKEKIKKYDELKLQKDLLQKENIELLEIKKISLELINKFENDNMIEENENLKKDLQRAEKANDVLQEKIHQLKQEITNLDKKISEKNTIITNLNNSLNSQKTKNIDR